VLFESFETQFWVMKAVKVLLMMRAAEFITLCTILLHHATKFRARKSVSERIEKLQFSV